MPRTHDNWERLVAAVRRREEYLELCRCPSLSSVASTDDLGSSSFCSLSSSVPDGHLDSPARLNWDAGVEDRVERWVMSSDAPLLRPLPRAIEGEQVAAGWPPWLSAVAGEALRGWVPRRADSFEKLDKIGTGTHSNVYKGRDLITEKFVALKKLKFDTLKPESVRFMAREILIMRRLDHPNVIRLEGIVTSQLSSSLYLVLEYMEHDLAGLASIPGVKFTEPQFKCYMQQFLRGLDHCHSRGVLHRDIKLSDLLIDSNGILKVADFGQATFYDPNKSHPMTSRVVSLWYRPAELLLGANYYSTAVDLWSTGCVLAELYAGKPVMPGRTEVEQLHKIFKLCGSPSEEYWRKYKLPHSTIFKPQQPYKRRLAETLKDFPAPALALIEILLSIDPADRGSTASALKSEFFTSKPHPCDPSDLPKYPPSKHYDIKKREKEPSRQAVAGSKGQSYNPENKGLRESHVLPVPGTKAQSNSSTWKRPGMSINEKFPFNRASNSMMRQYQKNNGSSEPHPFEVDDERASDSTFLLGYGSDGNKIYYSGPALAPSGKPLRRLLEDHDRQLQEVLRRAWLQSLNNASNSTMAQDQGNNGSVGDFKKARDERASDNNSVPLVHAAKSSKTHPTEPLLAPSDNMENFLMERRHRIEASRRAREARPRARLQQLQVE